MSARRSYTKRVRLTVAGPYDLRAALETYLIYPWLREDDGLVRILRCESRRGPVIVKAAVHQTGSIHRPSLELSLRSNEPLYQDIVAEATATMQHCLQLTEDWTHIRRLAKRDPILNAAQQHRGFGRGKLYPDLFEGVCGVICSQRTSFRRLYGMMQKIASTFGAHLCVDGTDYWAFPTPIDLASATEEQLRSCSVGFRAKYIRATASRFASETQRYREWHSAGLPALRERLLTMPGIGPYTADLIIATVYGQSLQAHIDSYVSSIIATFYFDGVPQDAETVARFVRTRWGRNAERVLDLLTTDTNAWASTLGIRVKVRSGARTE